MARAFLIVLDSVGCGGAPDAAGYGDAGANTLLHIARACAEGRADQGRRGALELPHLAALGLGTAVETACGAWPPGLARPSHGFWGAGQEASRGKDTPSGHWEIAGQPVPWDWGYFPKHAPAFPQDVRAEICAAAGTAGILGDCHSDGISVIEAEIAAHRATGWPICYTSSDSVLQIAAHEEWFGRERLLALCAELAPKMHARRIGRVIARPFVGDETEITRTPYRRDFAMAPPEGLLLEAAQKAGLTTHAVGKINDIFSGRGVGHAWKAANDAGLWAHVVRLAETAAEGTLVFANLVEFDSLYGHRRDVAGYARALEAFDRGLPALLAALRPEDLLIITADHGNDPTWAGTDHTRERVPIVGLGPCAGGVGLRAFSDIGASVARHLGFSLTGPGRAFL